MRILRPQQIEGEQDQQAYEEIQVAVEKLIAAKLITGKRVPESERVFFDKLHLTRKGEIEAIRRKDTPDYIVVNSPRPQRDEVL